MASRLDRLVTLLKTGSTQLIRNTAAQQLADVQKQHPEDLFNLIQRVLPYLADKSWDTRIAAAKAIGGIVENAERFDPNADDAPLKPETNGVASGEHAPAKKEEDSDGGLPRSSDQLELDTLDIVAILANGQKLLGSAGKEYDYKLAAMDANERLAYQKRSLVARLGLGGEYTEDELVTEKDIALPTSQSTAPLVSRPHKLSTQLSRSDDMCLSSPASATSPHDQASQTASDENGGLSKRQLNMLKRKNKKEAKDQASKVRVVDLAVRRSSYDTVSQTPAVPQPVAVRQEVKKEESNEESGGYGDYFSLERPTGDDDSKIVSEYKGLALPDKSMLQTEAEEEGLEWPFERLCEVMMVDLFDPHWEVRHGAAMCLREIVRVHGAGAGREYGKTRAQNDILNQRWLDDMACRLCCVFMLDRFGDYVSDSVVAPIRETVGQVLGALLQDVAASSVKSIYRILYRLIMQQDPGMEKGAWQACHGGIIGLRYLVAVRHDLVLKDTHMMDGVLEAVTKGLADYDDDVRSVSAATLIPVAKEFVQTRPSGVRTLITIVWECLSNLSDDLSASTGSVMDLLAKLCSFPEVMDAMAANAAEDPDQSFAELVPRLFIFLRHTITSVRSAVLRALLTFLDMKEEGTKDWINGRTLRLVFQNLIVERDSAVLKLSLLVWKSMIAAVRDQSEDKYVTEVGPHIEALISLTVAPIGVARHAMPIDPWLFIRPNGQTYAPVSQPTARRSPPVPVNGTSEPPAKRRRKSEKKERDAGPPSSVYNIDGPIIQGDVELVGMDVMIRTRVAAAEALADAIDAWPSTSRWSYFGDRLLYQITSVYSTTRLFATMAIEEYFKVSSDATGEFVKAFGPALVPVIEQPPPPCYSDLVSYLQITRAQCQNLLNTFRDLGHVPQSKLPCLAALVQGERNAGSFAFSIAQAEKIVGEDFDSWRRSLTPVQRIIASQPLDDAREDVRRAIVEAKRVKEHRDVRLKAGAAAAKVAMRDIPQKQSLTIKALMDSVKKEDNMDLQRRSSAAVANLIKALATRKPNIAEKVAVNLVKYCCMETAETPEFHVNAAKETGILSLKKEEDVREVENMKKFEEDARAARITRRGAKEALERLAHDLGSQLFERVPGLGKLMGGPIRECFEGDLPPDIRDPENEYGQSVVDALSTVRALAPSLDPGLHPFLLDILPLIVKALQSRLSVFRYAAAKCFATICSVLPAEGITMLVEKVIPSLSNPIEVVCRQGAIECIYHLIHVMEDNILPYVVFLIVPVLGRMSDSDEDVRLIATTTFATLVKLVPLEAGIPDPPGFSEELLKGREKERKFISQMLDVKKVEPFQIPVAIEAKLRSYQQDGVNWLAFLNRYNLHGILCDDMGLGKTLQTLCIVASDHHLRAEEFVRTGAPGKRPLPSLIVCPPSVSGHWQQELKMFAPFLSVAAYVGPPAVRSQVLDRLNSSDIVITSYDICRNDVDILKALNWNYCVLDEGHLIKNSKAKITTSVKLLQADHRLILSGTPIQNNVLELWSLFDFLMPGFLGSEKVFQDRFAKPIAASRFSKSSSKEQEAGALAIEALHKQVLPFLLRRLKEEVLNDLPPKILQNYYCDLSDLQKKLFEDFSKKEGKALAEKASSGDKEAKQHIFQALQYMRKLCNSPALVMKEGHKQYAATQEYLKRQHTSLQDPIHAPKLTALRDLLVDLGIGKEPAAPDKNGAKNGKAPDFSDMDVTSPHRALIFCQMKEMLDIVQSTVLRAMLPATTFLRLDGSVPASQRQDIVNKFNGDPSFDVLLLTTSVGGLGLNLTGADTVIFIEHDWNPQKDLQAMDRAHRIGQKRVVNVFRLVTRGTLEEKILNLQRFKIDVASTVVNQQNAGLLTMQTDQILDLFNLSDAAADPSALDMSSSSAGKGSGKPGEVSEENAVDATGELREKGKKGFLDELGQLWDESQYEEEYDLDSFLRSMRG